MCGLLGGLSSFGVSFIRGLAIACSNFRTEGWGGTHVTSEKPNVLGIYLENGWPTLCPGPAVVWEPNTEDWNMDAFG